MYVKVNEENSKKIDILAQGEDLCYLCVNMDECPLLAALQNEAVVLRFENIEIEKCGMYKEISLADLICFDP